MKNVTNTQYMFNCCYALNCTIYLSMDATKLTTINGTFNGTSSNENCTTKVNYTASLEEKIDELINTQSTSSNVVKGEKIEE